MIGSVSSALFSAFPSLGKSEKPQHEKFSYELPNLEIMNEENSASPDLCEEFQKSVSASSGVRAALFPEPTYSVSEKQAEYFREKYDLGNMPQGSEQEREFLDELASMNIISEKDAKLFNFNCGGSVESVSSYVSAVPFDENSSPLPMWEECFSDTDDLIDRLLSVIGTQKNICAYYDSKCGGENARQCDLDGASASRSFLMSKQRVLSVLQNISQSK